MQYICEKTSVQSILENLYSKKYVKQNGRLLEFGINNNTLLLNIYNEDSPPSLLEAQVLEKNVKGDFGICEDDEKQIHIAAANKKYDLIYMNFDGETLTKETIYSFGNNNYIPTTPVIQVKNGVVVIALEFLSVGFPKEWWLKAYIKQNQTWDCQTADRGAGLCYIQPDFKIDEAMNVHLVYREYKDKSIIKYVSFPVNQPLRDKPKAILESENDKYKPLVFVNRFGELSVSWLEFNGNDAVLCCSDISPQTGREIFKVDVSQNLSDVRIYFSGWHTYCIFQNHEDYYYDMCCRKKLVKQWNPKIIPKKGGTVMNSDFRLFLDIKRELENRISELKNNSNTGDYEKTISELKCLNMGLLEQIGDREKTIAAALNENNLLRSENEKIKGQIEQLEKQLQTQPEQAEEKKSVWDKINHFFTS